MLLTLFEMFDQGLVWQNRFEVTEELVASFRENWILLVHTEHKPEFRLPFFHLSGDKIWKLIAKTGKIIDKEFGSFKQLIEKAAWGEFDPALFTLLLQRDKRATLQAIILDTYFPEYKETFLAEKEHINYSSNRLTKSMVNESGVIYAEEDPEEAIYVRNGIFKKVVPRIYNYTCSISRMRVDSVYNTQMIDACHIVPFSVKHDDSITNHPYSIRKLDGVKILLPFNKEYYPAKENLEWHRNQIFTES
ncbi:MAG: hypothetical protein SF052_24735 [Bacteroidia bacterium]|nr:hypothetical protein [Bacteroidia bacterium]